MKRLGWFFGLLALGLFAAWWSLRGVEPGRPQPTGSGITGSTNQGPGTSTDPARATTANADPTRSNGRTEALDPKARPDLPQGLSGRIVGADGAPRPGATIDLLEGIARNPFDALVIAERGVVVPPSARAQSDEQGRFRIGAQGVSRRNYTLRVQAPGFAETVLAEVTIFEGRWTDLGDIKMERGLRLSGRITVQGAEGFPVPEATVTARPVGLTPLAAPTADREDGVTVACDASGRYLFESLPPGMTQITAVAPGFARVMRPTVDLRVDVENTCDIELPRGVSISGVVRDAAGHPLAGALVDARPLVNQQQPRADARSDADGRFEIIGLLDGAYVVGAVAAGHIRGERKPIRAGEREVEFALAPQPRVFVRVADVTGAVVPQYDLLLLRWRADSESLTGVPGAQIARVLPVDLDDGWFAFGGTDPGAYVLQVEAPGFAKSFSDPFDVKLEATRCEVQVLARKGATLRMRVVARDGQPLAGARVDTLPQFLDDNPLLRMLAEVVPTRTSQVHGETGRDGRLELQRLAAGSYQIRISHPDFCDTWARDLTLGDDDSVDLGTLAMQAGAVVTGNATLDGRPAGQIKVALVAIDADGATLLPQVLADAVTDDQGEFKLEKRLPPGRYVARARRETLPTPILQVLDYERTKQIVTIGPSQEQVRLHFALQSN